MTPVNCDNMNPLIEKIKEVEKPALKLEPGTEQRDAYRREVTRYSKDFLHRLNSDNAYNGNNDKTIINSLEVSETGKPLPQLLEIFEKAVEKPGINAASQGHLGYIPGGGLYPAALADYLAAVTNKYAGIYFGSPGAVLIENKMLDWLKEIMQFPKEATGHLSSGGSIATLTAITAARDAHAVTGAAAEKAVIYSSTQAHHCLHKAIRIAGLSPAIHREIPIDSQHKLPPDMLEVQIKKDKENGLQPFLVVSSAGTTDTGAVDDLDAISNIAQTYGLHHHVDAAYGGFFILVDSLKNQFKGIEKADSITIDPHKGMFLPYGIGAVLIKDTLSTMKSHHYKANYMRDAYSDDVDLSPADLSPELTKHFRGLRMWLPLHLFGVQAFRSALEEKNLLALYFEEEMRNNGFETGGKPELSVVIFRYKGDLNEQQAETFNNELVRRIHLDGRVFLSTTTINRQTWLRCAILSFRTHLSTIRQTVDIIKKLKKEIKAQNLE